MKTLQGTEVGHIEAVAVLDMPRTSGTGTANVGSSSNFVLHSSLSGGNLYPGTSNTVTFTVDNPSPGHQYLNTITLASVHACTGAGSSWNGTSCSSGGTEQTTCESVETGASDTNAANFWMAPVSVAICAGVTATDSDAEP